MPVDLETLRLVAQANHDRLHAQRDAIERMETKGAILLGFTITAAQFVVTADALSDGWRIASLVMYAAAFLYGVIVIRPYTHAYPADPATLYSKYARRREGEVLRVLAATRAKAFDKNAIVARRKTRAWWRTLLLLVVAVALSGVAAL